VTDLAAIWLQFAFCALLIGAAGPELSRSGDIIADKTNISATWIGLILLGAVTSLPELAAGVSAVTAADTPNIAVGDVFGSCVFNLLILVVVDFLHREAPIYRRAHQGHILSAGFGVILIGFAGVNLLIADHHANYTIGHVGLYTPILIALYLLAMRTVFTYEREHREAFVEGAAERYPCITLNAALVRYAIAAVVVVGAGVWLPFVGADLADAMGWRTTFVGSLFVAGATSIPELVVTHRRDTYRRAQHGDRQPAWEQSVRDARASHRRHLLRKGADPLGRVAGACLLGGFCGGDDRARHRESALPSWPKAVPRHRLDQYRAFCPLSVQQLRRFPTWRLIPSTPPRSFWPKPMSSSSGAAS
jgi:Ca2+/Na+ antiporter